MLQVVEINEIEHLESLRLRWTSLLNETAGGSFFHTLDWLKVYWRHLRDGRRLRVLLVHHGGTVFGILPLVMRQAATATEPVVVLTYPTINPSQFYGPIGPNPAATLMASFRYLAAESRDWDLLSVASIGEHDHGRAANALELAGFCPLETTHTSVSKVCFDATKPEHVSPCEADIAGDITCERIRPLGGIYGDDQPLEGIVDECFALPRNANWHSPFAESSAALLRDVVMAASRLGMLDLNLLRLDGSVIAFSVNVHFDTAIQQLCVGSTTASFDFQPASVLTRRILQDSFARKDRCLYCADSIDGEENFWATQQVPVVHYQHRAAIPLGTQLSRIGKWLASPLANA